MLRNVQQEKGMKSRALSITIGTFALLFFAGPVLAERIKDVASVAGVRSNQLVGYGLVVGLNGTGDRTTQAPFTVQSLLNALKQLDVTLPPGTSLQLKNIAAVAVHAELPPFRRSQTPKVCAGERYC